MWNNFLRLTYLLIRGIVLRSLLLVSYITPRNKNKYLCGCYTGFMDNSKYLYFELLKYRDFDAYWYTENKDEYLAVKKLGLPVIYCYSIKGLYHCLTAGNYVTTHNFHDYNEWTSGNVRLISLWHGIGPKNMYVENRKGKLLHRIIKWLSSYKAPIGMALCTSDFITEVYSKSIGFLKENAVYHTLPRCDFMLKDKEHIILHLQTINDTDTLSLLQKISKYDKVYLYMPTWRDNNSDFIASAGIDFEMLNNLLLIKNQIFLIKLHPNTDLNVDISHYSNILLMDKDIDIYPLLSSTDVLITDYSSIYYDYILLHNKEVIFYTFDINEYLSECRDFVIDFKTVTPGIHIKNFGELYKIIEENISCPFNDKERIIDIFWNKAKTPIIYSLIND